MKKLPPLNSLKAFYMVSKHHNFSKAALEMHVSQGAVSQQVGKLEEIVGQLLFKRLPRGVELTAEGKLLIYKVQKAFEIIEDAVEDLWLPNEESLLNITTVASIASYFVLPLLDDFLVTQPNININISTDQKLVDIQKMDFDFGIRYGRGNWNGLSSEALSGNEKIIVYSPKLLNDKNLLDDPVNLKSYPVIREDSYRELHAWLEKAGMLYYDPFSSLRIDDINLGIQAAIEGHGILLTHKILVQNELKTGRLLQAFNTSLAVETGYFIVYQTNQVLSKQARSMIEWLKRSSKNDESSVSEPVL